MTLFTKAKFFLTASLATVLIGCGGDSSSEVEVKKVESEAKQGLEDTAKNIDKMAVMADDGAQTTVQEVEEAVRNPKAEPPKTQAATTPQDNLKSDPVETKEQSAASMSQMQKQLTEQLGSAAAAELDSAMTSLKRQADDMIVTSAVDSLSRNLSMANNTGALQNLTALTDLAGQGKINPMSLNDVASISSASILSNAFSGGETPTLIENAIDSFTSSKLLSGSKDLLSSLSSVDMSASQTQTVNSMLDSLKPLLGTWGDNLDSIRETGGKVNDAASAIKSMF